MGKGSDQVEFAQRLGRTTPKRVTGIPASADVCFPSTEQQAAASLAEQGPGGYLVIGPKAIAETALLDYAFRQPWFRAWLDRYVRAALADYGVRETPN